MKEQSKLRRRKGIFVPNECFPENEPITFKTEEVFPFLSKPFGNPISAQSDERDRSAEDTSNANAICCSDGQEKLIAGNLIGQKLQGYEAMQASILGPAVKSLGVGTYRVDIKISGEIVGNSVFGLR
ncbi:MAG: hypothetical protein DMG84_18155 [Acidobacteria bacterium]|nr:MAG: hypothetical protein DMG84_18155 [Acidobacteriota bacterium]